MCWKTVIQLVNRLIFKHISRGAQETDGGLQDVGQFGVATGRRGLSRTSPIPITKLAHSI